MEKCSYSHSKSDDLAEDESCKVISKLLLPEDLLIHIFTLVPLTCLINSARYVCKSWAITIHSSDFAAAFNCRGHSKFGLYVENFMSRSSSYFLEFKDDVNCQFERTNFGTPDEMGYVIGTCDGLVLLFDYYMETYVVMNPILKCWLKIPPLPSPLEHIILSSKSTITRVPRTAKFKLFHVNVLEVSGVVWFVCYVLTIGIDNSWKEIARKETPSNINIDCWQRLCSGGNDLYWITENEVIVMDVDREIIIREYPLQYLSTIFSYLVMGDRLFCILLRHINRAHQFDIVYFDSEKWCLYCKTENIDFEAACGHELNIYSVLFRLLINDCLIIQFSLPTSPTEISFTCIEYIHFCYNLKTKQLTKIEDIGVGNFEVWLHTNSLVTLPSSPT